MVDDLEERLSRYRADLDAAVAADLARRRPTSGDAGFNDADPLLLDIDYPIQLEPTMSAPSDRRRVMLVAVLGVAAAVAALVVVGVVVSGDDAAPADQPSPTVTVSPTVWSPELTARLLDAPIACDQHCPHFAVSTDGTLVALDASGKTLTWYEDEPRPVSLAPGLGADILWAIGPYDIAYVGTPNFMVAVAPSGAEITRMGWTGLRSNQPVIATATGLVPGDAIGWSSVNTLQMPWVDLDGNPITDTSYPTLTRTDAGIEVQLGEREWLLTESTGTRPGAGPLYFTGLVPRSDGGVVVVLMTTVGDNVFELLPDGTIEHYFVENPVGVLPDGSLIAEHNLQLFRLTPPA